MPNRNEIEQKLAQLGARRTALNARASSVAHELEAARSERMTVLTGDNPGTTAAISQKIVALESEAQAITSAIASIDGEDAVLGRQLAQFNASDAQSRYAAVLEQTLASREPLTQACRRFATETVPPLLAAISDAGRTLAQAASAAATADTSAGRPAQTRRAQLQVIDERLPLGVMNAMRQLLEAVQFLQLQVKTADELAARKQVEDAQARARKLAEVAG